MARDLDHPYFFVGESGHDDAAFGYGTLLQPAELFGVCCHGRVQRGPVGAGVLPAFADDLVAVFAPKVGVEVVQEFFQSSRGGVVCASGAQSEHCFHGVYHAVPEFFGFEFCAEEGVGEFGGHFKGCLGAVFPFEVGVVAQFGVYFLQCPRTFAEAFGKVSFGGFEGVYRDGVDYFVEDVSGVSAPEVFREEVNGEFYYSNAVVCSACAVGEAVCEYEFHSYALCEVGGALHERGVFGVGVVPVEYLARFGDVGFPVFLDAELLEAFADLAAHGFEFRFALFCLGACVFHFVGCHSDLFACFCFHYFHRVAESFGDFHHCRVAVKDFPEALFFLLQDFLIPA